MNAPVSPASISIAQSPVEIAMSKLEQDMGDLAVMADIAGELGDTLYGELLAWKELGRPIDPRNDRCVERLMFAVNRVRWLARELNDSYLAALEAGTTEVQA